jgi:6-phosphogluconolactonase
VSERVGPDPDGREPAQIQRWHVYDDADQLVRHALRAVQRAAEEATLRGGCFDLVLAGGTTPRALYERLAAEGSGDERWRIWFGDERCLEAGHPDRNETMARAAWLDRSGIPEDRIHGIPAGPDPEVAAHAYGRLLAGVGTFDLVLLGIGEDGHTASLFPGHDPGAEPGAPDALAVRGAPKPPPERVSLSARRLGLARQVIVLVTGAGKTDAVTGWRRGDDLPVTRVRPPNGVDIFADRAALPAGAGGG